MAQDQESWEDQAKVHGVDGKANPKEEFPGSSGGACGFGVCEERGFFVLKSKLHLHQCRLGSIRFGLFGE